MQGRMEAALRIVVATLSVGVLVQVALLAIGQAEVPLAVAADVPTGERLPKVRLESQLEAARPEAFADVELTAVFGARCGMVVFYTSTCPGAALIGDLWRGRASIDAPGGPLPVAWVNVNPADSGAAAYLERHGIVAPTYRFLSVQDRRLAGISLWPSAYLIGPDGRLLARPDASSSHLNEVPADCVEGSPSRSRQTVPEGQ